MLDPEPITRVGFIYASKNTEVTPPIATLNFTSSSRVHVLLTDPGLPTLRKNDRIKLSAPIAVPEAISSQQTIRRILQIDRWEPVWTLIDNDRRQAWNRTER